MNGQIKAYQATLPNFKIPQVVYAISFGEAIKLFNNNPILRHTLYKPYIKLVKGFRNEQST